MPPGGPPQNPSFFKNAGRPWAGNLIVNDNGAPRPLLFNAMIVLGEASEFADVFRYDIFRCHTIIRAPVPWDPHPNKLPREWKDHDDREVTAWLQDNGLTINESVAASAVQAIAERHPVHPVSEYLSGLQWDGIKRIAYWLTRYAGVEETPFCLAIAERWLISAVARIGDPGCKADCVLIMEGPEGIGKSTLFSILGGPYYSNDIAALGTKEAQEQILGVWILELDELDAITQARELASVKAFVSRGTDRFRLPYHRRSTAFPRQCVFGATTNLDDWHRDPTGGRRWWPVRADKIDLDGLALARDQLWAEAVAGFSEERKWWLHEPELIKAQREEIDKRHPGDAWDEQIIAALAGRSRISLGGLLSELKIPIERRDGRMMSRLAGIMRRIHWDRWRDPVSSVVYYLRSSKLV